MTRVEAALDEDLLRTVGGSLTTRLQEIVEAASRTVRRPVAIDDRHLRLLVYTEQPPEDVDEVRLLTIMKRPVPTEVMAWLRRHDISSAIDPIVIEGNAELAFDARVCAPIRCHDHLLGYMWLTDRDRSMTPEDLALVAEFADEAGIVLYRELLLRDLERSRERELVRDILSSDETLCRHAAAQLAELEIFTARGGVVVLLSPISRCDDDWGAESARLAMDTALSRARRYLAPGHGLHLTRPDHGLLVASLGDSALRTHGIAAFGSRLCHELASSFGENSDGHYVVAAGGSVPELKDASISYVQARRAAAVRMTMSNFGNVVCWDDLGIYKILAELPLDALGPEAMRRGLRALIDDPRTHPLVKTLEAFLDHAGDVQATAAALFIHRTSLYHRLRRVEQLADVDLANGDDRLDLHLGLKIARLQGLSWDVESEPST